VHQGYLECAAIGGGTGGTSGNGGAAKIDIDGGTIKTGSIGGGSTENKTNGKLGYATAVINGGDISGQFLLMAGGTAPCFFKMYAGVLHDVYAADEKYTMKNGAAVYMDDPDGIVSIYGGIIKDCSATNGGAIYMTNGKFVMSGGEITNCTATENGGAVYLGGGSVTLGGGRISSCHATTGGAIYLQAGDAVLSGGTLENCYAEQAEGAQGGALYIANGTMTMSDGRISDCYTVVPGTEPIANRISGLGGALYIADGAMTMSGGTISGCKATDGGGIYLPGGDFVMTGGTLSFNGALRNGGGVYLANGGNLTLNGESALIDQNTAVNGAGVYLAGGEPNLFYGTISGNIADGKGGGIFIDKLKVQLQPKKTVRFSGNKAFDGAGMYISGEEGASAGFSVDASTGSVIFEGNIATGSGGGVCLSYGDMHITNEQILLYGNEAANGGGAAVLNGSFTLTGGSIGSSGATVNKAINGGGVYVSGGNVTVSGTGTITNNEATNGGGVYLTGGYFMLDGAQTLIHKNTAENGGGVYLTKINPSLLSGSITDNTATGSGGGIYISDQVVELDPRGTVILSGNEAAVNGGAVYIKGTDISPAGFEVLNTDLDGKVILQDNESSIGGGVCVNNGYFNIKHDNITIIRNTANFGGGIAVLSGNFTMNAGSVGAVGNGNSAENGGGLYVVGGSVQINDGTVAYNTALNGGGAYVSGSGGLVLNGGSFQFNSVSPTDQYAANGGGFYIDGGNFTMSGGSVICNTANADDFGLGGYGGGFYISGGSFNMNNGIVAQNIAAASQTQNGGYGGGGYINGGDFIMRDGMLGGASLSDANTAVNGGGLYVSDGNVTIINGMIQYNSASADGGGLYVSSQMNPVEVIMLSGYLCNNFAGVNGGGMAVCSPSGTGKSIYVYVGCLLDHAGGGAIPYTGDYKVYSEEGANKHELCPQVYGNTALVAGGGFYLNSSDSNLHYYCIYEDPAYPNIAAGNHSCHSLDVEGGTVVIGDPDYHNHKAAISHDTPWGNVQLSGTILVNGGKVDVYGDMDNPLFVSEIRVNITNTANNYFIDHRRAKEDDIQYKIHYIENFFGTGEYKAVQAKKHSDGTCNVAISGTMFERAGYKIVGWNTEKQGTGVEYRVGTTYNLAKLGTEDGIGIHSSACTLCAQAGDDSYQLVLYAQWQKKGYVIFFVSNAPSGVTWEGEMELMKCTQDVVYTLPANQFKCAGYKFAGWSLTPQGSVVYPDQADNVKNLTMEDSKSVYLYAQWTDCNHDNLIYKAVNNVLSESCSDCIGHEAKAMVSAYSVDYDGDHHPAAIIGDIQKPNWLGTTPTLNYVKLKDPAWDEADLDDVYAQWGDDGSPEAPIHAGTYYAQLIVGEVIAQCEYTIKRVQWETPPLPYYEKTEVDGKKGIQIITPVSAPNDITKQKYQYGIQYQTNGVLTELQWQDDIFIQTPQTNTFYHIYAKAKADRNHLESKVSQVIQFLSDLANVRFIRDEGAIFTETPVAGDQKFTFVAGVDNNYHKRNWSVTLYEGSENSQGVICLPDENGKYVLSGLNSNKDYVVKITGVGINASSEGKAIYNQVFTDFLDAGSFQISRDSSFTVRYTVKNYRPDEYTDQALTFNTALPIGTTLIMMADDTYWCYTVNAPTVSIPLGSFHKMGGGTEPFVYAVTGSAPKTFSYQFIVDFSRVKALPPVGSLDVTFSAVPNTKITIDSKEYTCTIPELTRTRSVSMVGEASFQLEAATSGDTATVSYKYTYTPSAGHASIWENRESALILTVSSTQTLPADLSVSVSANNQTTKYIMKPGNRFIIPTGSLTDKTKTLQIQFLSELIPTEGIALQFSIDWMVSRTVADLSPLNGDPVDSLPSQTCTLSPTPIPSLKVTAGSRLARVGETYDVSFESRNIEEDWNLTLYLYRKETTETSSNYGEFLYTGYYEVLEGSSDPQNISVSLRGQEAGSFYLFVTATEGEGADRLIKAETRFYFIAQD